MELVKITQEQANLTHTVTIVITPKGYTTTVKLGEDSFITEWEVTNYGGTALDKGFEDEEEMPDYLYEAIESNDLLDIAKALRTVKSEDDRS